MPKTQRKRGCDDEELAGGKSGSHAPIGNPEGERAEQCHNGKTEPGARARHRLSR